MESRGDFGVKDDVPKSAGNSETHFIVLVVVFQVVCLQVLEELRQIGVVQHVMRHIVHDVSQGTTCETRASHVEGEELENEAIEWICQNDKHGWRQDQSVSVHRQVVVDTVQKEMKGQAVLVIRQVLIQVEQKSMQTVLNKCPDEQTHHP